MELVEHYLVGVPNNQRQRVITEMLRNFWSQHREHLTTIADKNHPFRDSCLEDLQMWKELASQCLAADFFEKSLQGYGFASKLASLNIPQSEVIARYAARSPKVGFKDRTDVLKDPSFKTA
jgi:hypothetical protein